MEEVGQVDMYTTWLDISRKPAPPPGIVDKVAAFTMLMDDAPWCRIQFHRYCRNVVSCRSCIYMK